MQNNAIHSSEASRGKFTQAAGCCCFKPSLVTYCLLIIGSLQHFSDLVAGHFRVHGYTILAACKYYMEGNAIGSVVPEDEEESDCLCSDAGASSSSETLNTVPSTVNPLAKPRTSFNTSLKTLFEDLLMEFNVKGADTRKFLVEKIKKNLSAP
jgi:ubiquitin-conjugating enzyme E2 O